MRVLLSLFLIILSIHPCFAIHRHSERWYQDKHCSGIKEYTLPDGARVDCLTDEYAGEFEFAKKWAESIGQSLYYANMTGKKPMVYFIMEDPVKDLRYYNRLKTVADKYNITTVKIYN